MHLGLALQLEPWTHTVFQGLISPFSKSCIDSQDLPWRLIATCCQHNSLAMKFQEIFSKFSGIFGDNLQMIKLLSWQHYNENCYQTDGSTILHHNNNMAICLGHNVINWQSYELNEHYVSLKSGQNISTKVIQQKVSSVSTKLTRSLLLILPLSPHATP